MAALLLSFSFLIAGSANEVQADDFPSLHAALDQNPGRVIHLSDRDYLIDRSLVVTTDRTCLVGPGRIVMSRASDSIIRVEGADDVRIEGIELTRSEGAMETTEDALRATDCRRLLVRGVRVHDNHSPSASIRGHRLVQSRIRDCDITNYKTVGVEDRTENPDFGVAFRAVLGDGITITESQNVDISGNRIVEERIVTEEAFAKTHQLGELTDGRRPMKRGPLAPKDNYTRLWHQGSAIVITSPESTRHLVVTGNVIVNASQGVDIHADDVIFSSNSIDQALIGIKCMHGSRNVVISGNTVSRATLWGLVMMPGSASHPVDSNVQPPKPANRTAANVVMGNIFSEMGYGHDWHNWGQTGSCRAMTFEAGPGPDAPPLVDVVVSGNIVHDEGPDDGGTPRFEYALVVEPALDRSRFRIQGNVLTRGR